MLVKYESRFQRDLKRIKDRSVLQRLKSIINETKQAQDISDLPNLTKIKG